jgi:predicted nucleotidyltransferase
MIEKFMELMWYDEYIEISDHTIEFNLSHYYNKDDIKYFIENNITKEQIYLRDDYIFNICDENWWDLPEWFNCYSFFEKQK